MKSYDKTSDNDTQSRSAANDQRQIAASEKGAMDSPDSTAQGKHTDVINSSPYMASQRKRLRGIPGQALQKQEGTEEDELLQGKSAAQMQPEDEEELMQGKLTSQRQPMEDEELMQGKFTAQMQPEEDEALMQGKFTAQMKPDENRTGMPEELKANMESVFNTNFSDVRVHANSGKATQVGALAYTQGTDVHFAPGQFKPESSAGQQLLGHELTHVVQQGQGRVKPTGEVAGMPLNDSPALENEADEMGAQASQRTTQRKNER